MIIGINGYSGSGKDTIGAIIQYLKSPDVGNITIEDVCKDYEKYELVLDEKSDWQIRKFASKLKDIASHLTGIDIEDFEDQEFKKTNLDAEWWTTCDEGHQPMTVRDFLQKLGTDALRNGLHPNVWVNALMSDYKKQLRIETNHPHSEHLTTRYPNWIITDVRFENEAKAIKDKGGVVIRVDRPGVSPINNHPSETSLDNWKFDYKVFNLSGIFELKDTMANILNHLKLL
jgi:ABC-type oligopeptide transport system ATPase subunit